MGTGATLRYLGPQLVAVLAAPGERGARARAAGRARVVVLARRARGRGGRRRAGRADARRGARRRRVRRARVDGVRRLFEAVEAAGRRPVRAPVRPLLAVDHDLVALLPVLGQSHLFVKFTLSLAFHRRFSFLSSFCFGKERAMLELID